GKNAAADHRIERPLHQAPYQRRNFAGIMLAIGIHGDDDIRPQFFCGTAAGDGSRADPKIREMPDDERAAVPCGITGAVVRSVVNHDWYDSHPVDCRRYMRYHTGNDARFIMRGHDDCYGPFNWLSWSAHCNLAFKLFPPNSAIHDTIVSAIRLHS